MNPSVGYVTINKYVIVFGKEDSKEIFVYNITTNEWIICDKTLKLKLSNFCCSKSEYFFSIFNLFKKLFSVINNLSFESGFSRKSSAPIFVAYGWSWVARGCVREGVSDGLA